MNRKILFVDDEQNVLEALQRQLRSMRDVWDMHFSISAEDSLEELKKETYDIIVTDMRMPGMNGLELLKIVRNLYPDMIRFILSGHSDREMILKSVPLAHQYISKPCDPATLKNTIQHTLKLRNLLKNETLTELAAKLTTIPSLPTLYNQLIEELQSPEATLKSVGNIIEKDVGMTAKILQLVNSAFFGLNRSLSSADQAVNYLGMDIIKSLVLSIEVFEQYHETHCRSFSLEALQDHSLMCASVARAITKEEKKDKTLIGNSFMAGILHDMGKLLLVVNLPEEYDRMNQLRKHEKISVEEAEKIVFGASHAEVGAYLLGLWGFPDTILEAVAYHHQPSFSNVATFTPLTAVHAANVICRQAAEDIEDWDSISMDISYLENLGMADKLVIWRTISKKYT